MSSLFLSLRKIFKMTIKEMIFVNLFLQYPLNLQILLIFDQIYFKQTKMYDQGTDSLASQQRLDQQEYAKLQRKQYPPSQFAKLAGSPVPIVSFTKNVEKITLGKEKKEKEQEKKDKKQIENKNSKQKQQEKMMFQDVMAFGNLIGVNQMGGNVRALGLFQGSFEGIFMFQVEDGQTIAYFEGKIKKITNKIAIKIQGNQQNIQGSELKYIQNACYPQKMKIICQNEDNDADINLNSLTYLKGAFKGSFHKVDQKLIDQFKAISKENKQGIIKGLNKEGINKEVENHLKNEKQEKSKIQVDSNKKNEDIAYMIPALLTFDLRKITQINLQKSSANLAGTIKIDIRLNQEICEILQKDQQKYHQKLDKQKKDGMTTQDIKKIKKKFQMAIDFHRGKLMNLPFYNVDDDGEDDDVEYEWADPWDGISLTSQWDSENMIMSYRITTIFTAQISNSYGIFYSPFNLNILKLVIDFHAIKIGKTRININCCDLSDSFNRQKYSPYTQFTDLETNEIKNENKKKDVTFRKHFDRRSKINIDNFIDQGQYKLADNRITLFPYYKRVFVNSQLLTRSWQWTLGLTPKQELIKVPQVSTIKGSYEQINNKPTKKYENFDFPIWQFVHVEIPIFKYAVIDMIRIFVPILILSTISLLIFVQENAKDGNGFTTLAKRIASGCSLMIAYVALVPLIRAKLPPTPSVTLIEILIYSSTIPNFLAIISNLTTDFVNFNDFFDKYRAFTDGLFIASFVISIFSFTVLMIVTTIFGYKNYQSDLQFNKIVPATVSGMRSPIFLDFIQKVRNYRPQYHLKQQDLPLISSS